MLKTNKWLGIKLSCGKWYLDDVRFMTEEGEELLEDCDNEDEIFDFTNLLYVPKMNMDIPLHMLDLLQDIIFKLMVPIVFTYSLIKN